MKGKILLKYGNINIPITLNDTVAAKDFQRRLPVVLSGKRLKDNYCFPAAIGCYDPQETQYGWKNGDISISHGHFRILFGGEEVSEEYAGIMVIAHLDEENLVQIKELPDAVRIRIETEEC